MRLLSYTGGDRKDKFIFTLISRDIPKQVSMCHIFRCSVTVCVLTYRLPWSHLPRESR